MWCCCECGCVDWVVGCQCVVFVGQMCGECVGCECVVVVLVDFEILFELFDYVWKDWMCDQDFLYCYFCMLWMDGGVLCVVGIVCLGLKVVSLCCEEKL